MVEIIYKMNKPYKEDYKLGKVGKRAKIKNRYNQVPHLTQDTTWQSDKHNKTSQTRAKGSVLSKQVTTRHQ